MSPSRRPRRLVWIASPFAIWVLHFVLVYSIQGLVCARGWPLSVAWLGMALVTLPAFAAVAWLGLDARRRAASADAAGEKRFAARLVAMLALLALLAMMFTIVPVLLLNPCE